MTASAVSKTLPQPFTPAPLPTLPNGQGPYMQTMLGKVSDSILSTQRFAPQAAMAAPKILIDGMIRLSRAPWRPVSGQTTDQWVYYDAAGPAWRLMGTAPTNT